VTELKTFRLPDVVSGSDADQELARRLIAAWREDGIFQVAATDAQHDATEQAFAASKRYFSLPQPVKAQCVSDLTYSGYIASGEEMTAGQADYSEIYTVCKDVPPHDPRVQAQWPCHGPTPWPDDHYRRDMSAFMGHLGEIGEKLLKLTALGLAQPIDTLTRFTDDGWHHMRVLRFPTESAKSARGIGAHTDYGLLVIAAQDDVGGLWIRPPVAGEDRPRNWLASESSAGVYEHEEPWTFVKPVPRVFTVFPGDILQFITGSSLLSTPHKVRLASRERYAMAYFHEPNFNAVVRPLRDNQTGDFIHYGSHFTNMFRRSYKDRITTRRIHEENRLARLAELQSD
jgi:2-oxoglutarate dioxygenase / 2-oxoglutarate/L-arginine monooxygenase/decarboxylase